MKSRLRVPETPEFLRSAALREVPRISSYGWRPSPQDIAQLRGSLRDPASYRVLLRAWRRGGFPLMAARKLAGRAPRRP
jgi:hypothetical protein